MNRIDLSWPVASDAAVPGSDEVHVWSSFLDLSDSRRADLLSQLSQNELERVGQFRFPKDRNDFIVSHGILREILASYLDINPAGLRFTYNAYGKPSLEVEGKSTNIHFNLSHSQGLALFAVTQVGRIGVDVEYIRPEVAADRTAESAFSPSEIELLRSLPEDLQARAFFQCWTLKEAFIKARGQGLSIPLDQFDVSFLPGQPVRLLNTQWDTEEAARWCLRDLDFGNIYAAGIAVEGRGWNMKCRSWSNSTTMHF